MAFAAGAAMFITAGSVYTSRKARKSAERIAGEQFQREEAQLLKEEKLLDESKISARQRAISERRARSIRAGRSSTIIAGRGATPNLTQLGQIRKRQLGSGA